jgi:hypothetical protein
MVARMHWREQIHCLRTMQNARYVFNVARDAPAFFGLVDQLSTLSVGDQAVEALGLWLHRTIGLANICL